MKKPTTLLQLIGRRMYALSADSQIAVDRTIREIETLVREFMPSGSGFDAGTEFYFDGSGPRKLQFITKFHHMDEVGQYDGWTDHVIKVEPEFEGFSIKLTGKDRDGIKDYILDTFTHALNQKIVATFDPEAGQFNFVAVDGKPPQAEFSTIRGILNDNVRTGPMIVEVTSFGNKDGPIINFGNIWSRPEYFVRIPSKTLQELETAFSEVRDLGQAAEDDRAKFCLHAFNTFSNDPETTTNPAALKAQFIEIMQDLASQSPSTTPTP